MRLQTIHRYLFFSIADQNHIKLITFVFYSKWPIIFGRQRRLYTATPDENIVRRPQLLCGWSWRRHRRIRALPQRQRHEIAAV
jgi:hypothetical protein